MKKKLIILSLFAIVTSCSLFKKSDDTVSNTDTTVIVEDAKSNEPEVDENIEKAGLIMAEGHVRDKTREGCGFVIEVYIDKDSMLVEPLNIPVEHQEDGKHVKLTYRMSKRASKCTIALPIVIDRIIG